MLKIVYIGKFFWQKIFFVNMDVYFQNMARAVEAAIMQAKVRLKVTKSYSLSRLSVFLNSLIRRYTIGNMHHLIGRNIALLGNYILINIA